MLHDVEFIEKAALVVVDPREDWEAEANTNELVLLAESAGVEVVDEMHLHRQHPDPRYYIGSGNAEEVFMRVNESGADFVIVGENLSPSQQRNLSNVTKVEVIDRTQLILDIFAQRARTSEGKLQVELAQLQYLLPRLSGRGASMSRIGGGAGGGVATRGPGETKLETDRRRVRTRIAELKDSLDDVVQHREVQNQARRKLLVPGAALVGYTSAGKSTLMNMLADSDVSAHERLFETLDPTTRKIDMENGTTLLLSDTVGFIRNLPHHLVAAFRATLEEVTEADFLIHVVDASHPFVDQQRASVMEVLSELGAQDKPIITVFNKSDRVMDHYELRRLTAITPRSCFMSAKTGDGLEDLEKLITKTVSEMFNRIRVLLPFDRGDLLALAHDRGRVIEFEYRHDGIYLEAELSGDLAARLKPYLIDKDLQ